MMVKWCTGQYEISFLKAKAEKMKELGDIVRYRIRKTDSGYGYLYIECTRD